MIKRIAVTAIIFGVIVCFPHSGKGQTAWNKIVAEAKKEGTVVVNGPSIRELSQGLTEGSKKPMALTLNI